MNRAERRHPFTSTREFYQPWEVPTCFIAGQMNEEVYRDGCMQTADEWFDRMPLVVWERSSPAIEDERWSWK